MKIKPKEIKVVLPAFYLFDDEQEIVAFARDVNRIMHGYTRIKCESMGMAGNQYVGLFYLERDKEYNEFRAFVKNNILNEEYRDEREWDPS
jgi:hypothetical protein